MNIESAADRLVDAVLGEATGDQHLQPGYYGSREAAIQSVSGEPYDDFISKSIPSYHVDRDRYDYLGKAVIIAKPDTDLSQWPHMYYNKQSWPREQTILLSKEPIDWGDPHKQMVELTGPAREMAEQIIKGGGRFSHAKDRAIQKSMRTPPAA